MKYIIIFLMYFLQIATLNAQNDRISGCVYNEFNEQLENAHVTILYQNITIAAGNKGCFELSFPNLNSFTLKIQYIGYKPFYKKFTKASKKINLSFYLKENDSTLDEIIIQGKSKAEKIRDQAYAVNVIETEVFKNTATNISQVLNKVPGIIIREEGGLGSDFNLSLNGLSGKQIKTFIDGIPMSYFGRSLTLNNFPSNIIESIEVYKGVVPIYLSSDALGGAINIQTKKQTNNYLDASYSIGSFNTHKASLNTQYYDKNSGFTARLKSFYNYSDNDYVIDIIIPGEGGKITDETTKVKRFHNAYTSKMGQLEVGITNKKYADELLVGILFSDNYKEIQHTRLPGKIINPFGEVFEKNKSRISTLKYAKKGVFKNLDVRSFLALVDNERRYEDKSNHRYFWNGEIKYDDHMATGEQNRKTELTLNQENILVNFNVQYQLPKDQIVAVNFSTDYFKMEGNDPLHPRNNTQFGTPSRVDKKVTGLSYSFNLFDEKLKGILFGKRYNYNINSLVTDFSGSLKEYKNIASNFTGYGGALTYLFTKNTQIKTSFENAIRFPENLEILGNGMAILTNINLKPETSTNINLGFRTNQYLGDKHKIHFETNTFLRSSKNFIYLRPELIFQVNDNLEKVLTKGIEGELQYTFNDAYSIGVSATYLDIRDKNKFAGNSTRLNPFLDARIPNTPYLFGNLKLNYNTTNVFRKDDRLSVTSFQNYIHGYSLFFAEIGNEDQKLIKNQLAQNIEAVYSFKNGTYNLSIAANNIFNANITDNYNLQKPGRNFSLKLRYYLSK
ncbi:hypothetical protein CXF68_03235 [Tenacibaculum sp. Bg11-29]|uniref:TonB-dependent receptor n=1 Tax=Tenacibaculum sp. Bg11-29 TaxID=2058306 RepID=UPI000C3306B2|nr:TonB-dependent receptor plug domain-containing protein [Tenacibaculum sp. Bg11-29]PKH49769.1 hypothetical protein CXF68_03235 [Tenacibaculum sp. Bg11-29]